MELEFEADCKLNAVEMPRKWLWTKKTTTLYVDQQNIIQHWLFTTVIPIFVKNETEWLGEAVLSHLCVYRSIKRQRNVSPSCSTKKPTLLETLLLIFFSPDVQSDHIAAGCAKGVPTRREWNGISPGGWKKRPHFSRLRQHHPRRYFILQDEC